MTTEPAATMDPTRRALLAALAGGLALAAPVPAKGQVKGKKGKKPKPPLAVAIAQTTAVESRVGASGQPFLDISVAVAGFDLRPDPPASIDGGLSFVITAGPAARMRDDIQLAIRGFAASQAGDVAIDRVQVLII